MLREGSAWRDLAQLAPVITSGEVDTRFACLISDDTHPHTLVAEGHLDHILRRAVAEGIDPITALQMVTINTATCFRMDNELGSVTPGKCADLVLLADLESFEVTRVFIDGEEVARDGRLSFELAPYEYPEWVTHSMHVGTQITAETFAVAAVSAAADAVAAADTAAGEDVAVASAAADAVAAADTAAGEDAAVTDAAASAAAGETPVAPAATAAPLAKVRVIEVIPERVGTLECHLELPVVDGRIEADPAQDTLKAFVFERHHDTGSFGAGFVKGFGIKNGALASTVAHDAHNLLVLGSNDADMALAANTLIASGGGMVAVQDGKVLGHVALPIAGLMDDLSAVEMAKKVAALEGAWQTMGCSMGSPFMTMALIPLACLPELRLTNRGLVDCTTFSFTSLYL
jgi:adenine deaminase